VGTGLAGMCVAQHTCFGEPKASNRLHTIPSLHWFTWLPGCLPCCWPSYLWWALPCQAQQASGADVQIHDFAPAEVGLSAAHVEGLGAKQKLLAGSMGARHSSPMPEKGCQIASTVQEAG